MSTMPAAVRREVIEELYRQLDALRWESLPAPQSTAAYAKFVADPLIGGKLAPYMAESKVRVWIKDGPAKEYRRALEGIGSFAEFTSRAFPGPQVLVSSALGEGWSVVPGSVEQKPMRCLARNGEGQERFVVWGTEASLKELVWHAAQFKARSRDSAPMIAITKPSLGPVDIATWQLATSISDVLGADCRQITQQASKKPLPDQK